MLFWDTRPRISPEDAAPVVALTARSDAEERQKALKAGFARFLTKPVDPEQLVHEICNVLEPDWVFLTKTAKSQFVSKNSDLSPAPRRPYRGLPPRDYPISGGRPTAHILKAVGPVEVSRAACRGR